jgi:hypothetical protein
MVAAPPRLRSQDQKPCPTVCPLNSAFYRLRSSYLAYVIAGHAVNRRRESDASALPNGFTRLRSWFRNAQLVSVMDPHSLRDCNGVGE